MDIASTILDQLWNLKFLKNHRTKIARSVTFLLAAYQGIATSQTLIEQGMDLPDINAALFIGVIGYLQLKVKQWAREHKPA